VYEVFSRAEPYVGEVAHPTPLPPERKFAQTNPKPSFRAAGRALQGPQKQQNGVLGPQQPPPKTIPWAQQPPPVTPKTLFLGPPGAWCIARFQVAPKPSHAVRVRSSRSAPARKLGALKVKQAGRGGRGELYSQASYRGDTRPTTSAKQDCQGGAQQATQWAERHCTAPQRASQIILTNQSCQKLKEAKMKPNSTSLTKVAEDKDPMWKRRQSGRSRRSGFLLCFRSEVR
jgi:hypothetical protein